MHHVAVYVSDIDRIMNLFTAHLGFELQWRAPKVGGHKLAAISGFPEFEAEMAYLHSPSGGVDVELVRMIRPDMGGRTIEYAAAGSVVLSLVVDELPGRHQRLVREGWTFFSEPVRLSSPEGEPILLCFLQTEDRLVIELIEFL